MIRPGFSFPAIFALCVAFLGIVGPMDYADALNTEAEEKVARVERVLLETSMQPATLNECQRARPQRLRPDGAISLQSRSNKPWHHRTCFWAGLPEKGQP